MPLSILSAVYGANKETHNMIFIKDQHINLSRDVSNTNQNYSIFDAKGEKIIHVNPQQKAYMQMDKATIDEQVSKMKKSIEMMRCTDGRKEIKNHACGSTKNDAKNDGDTRFRPSDKDASQTDQKTY